MSTGAAGVTGAAGTAEAAGAAGAAGAARLAESAAVKYVFAAAGVYYNGSRSLLVYSVTIGPQPRTILRYPE